MGSTGLESCEHCGRMRWAADRFCAECGEAFSEQRTTELQEFDADALAPAAPLGADPEQAQRFPRAFVIAAGGLVALLLVFGLFAPGGVDPDQAASADGTGGGVDLAPMSGFGGSPTVTPVPQFDDPEEDLASDSGLPITPVPPRPDPAENAEDEAASDAATSATAASSGTPSAATLNPADASEASTARSALLDHLLDADLSLGAAWIATVTDDHRPRAVNVRTGEEIVLERANQFGAPIFFTPDGAYSVGMSGKGDSRSSWLSIQPWSGAESGATRLISGDFIGAYDDPERGIVVLSAPADTASAGRALDVDVDEAVRFELPDGATTDDQWARFAHASFGTKDNIAASTGGAIWAWTWADGWTRLGDGEVIIVGRHEIVTRSCPEAFDGCDVTIRWPAGQAELGRVPIGPDWKVATYHDGRITKPTRFALSGDVLLSGESAGGATIISLWDLDAGTTLEVGLDVREVFWMTYSPNGQYLFVSSSTGTSVIDTATGDLVLVNRRASGTINGLSPSPLVFLHTIRR